MRAGCGVVVAFAFEDAVQIEEVEVMWIGGEQLVAKRARKGKVTVQNQDAKKEPLRFYVVGMEACRFFCYTRGILVADLIDVDRGQRIGEKKRRGIRPQRLCECVGC